MVAVFASRGRSQPDDKLRLYLPSHLFKRERREVVAFVNNHVAIFGDESSVGK